MSKIDNEIKEGTPRFKKGDAFVGMAPHPLVFMEVNEVEGNAGNKDFCIVTWYSFDEKGLNAQCRFPMVAVDGEFCDFEPISRSLLKDVKSLMCQYDSEVRQLTDKKKAKSLCKEYNRKFTELLPDAEERLAIAITGWKKILTSMTCTLHLSVTLPNHTMMRITKTLPYNFSICMMTVRMAGIRLQNVGPSIW